MTLATTGATPLSCSGQLGRLDLVPAGGYVAWLFRKGELGDWERELRMPLIQGIVSDSLLRVPASEVQVGVYAIAAKEVALRTFADSEIKDARSELDHLVVAMGF
jgi:hypothetical protein